MNWKPIAQHLLTLVTRILDSDGDGRVEIADIPGVIAKAAALEAQGRQLLDAGQASYHALLSAARGGLLTSGGQPVTAADVAAAWDRAKAPYTIAADEARAALGPQGEA